MNDKINLIKNDIHNVIFEQFPVEVIGLLEQMSISEIAELLTSQDISKTIKIWERISPQLGARVLESLPPINSASVLTHIDPNRGASLLKCFDEVKQEELLNKIEPGIANDLRRAVKSEADTAGALMDAQVMYFRPKMTIAETINTLRTRPKGVYRKIYTVDEANHLKGMIEMEDLALADHDARLSEIEKISPAVVQVTTSREELVELFEKFKLTDLPVIDFEQRLVGVIRYHTLVEAARVEGSVDMQTMVGVSKDERALSPASFAIKKRLPWLQINLLTAFLAAAVVGLFESTIAQYTALAVLLPVVAGQSGNTGAQALAVSMRGLALKEIYPHMWMRIIFKESSVGFWNGIAVALTTGIGVYVWSHSMGLTLVIAFSMVLSMTIASIAGAGIPILLTITGQDPAQSSSIFLTTITDVVGFFSFLGIATLFIHML